MWSGGLWWESGPLRYARVHGAGHMVPWDKPVEALHMFTLWLDKKGLNILYLTPRSYCAWTLTLDSR